MKELFLEQMRVIDSHPYENVGDDGEPLLDGGEAGAAGGTSKGVGGGERSSRGGRDSVNPEYETIFVKGREHFFVGRYLG